MMRKWQLVVAVAWSALMLGWTATYLGGIGTCLETGWQLTVCEAGRFIGTEIGFPFIVAVSLLGFAAIVVAPRLVRSER
jgi:hypothetical protein